MDKQKPLISVIMGIYNCANTLPDAIDAILSQTVTDWELILCDDGSVDATFQVAEAYRDKYPNKIRLLRNERNCGLNDTLNLCLKVAAGKYIARMDGDDLCTPDRFEEELAVLESEPDISIVSSDMACFDEAGVWGCVHHKEYPEARDFLKGSPFCHAPCMVRREAYEAVNGYSVEEKLVRVEDYHLWIKMYAAGFRGKNIARPLYQMRDDQNASQRRKFQYRLNEAYVICLAVKLLKLPKLSYIYAFRPILVGLLPKRLYGVLHKKHLRN